MKKIKIIVLSIMALCSPSKSQTLLTNYNTGLMWNTNNSNKWIENLFVISEGSPDRFGILFNQNGTGTLSSPKRFVILNTSDKTKELELTNLSSSGTWKISKKNSSDFVLINTNTSNGTSATYYRFQYDFNTRKLITKAAENYLSGTLCFADGQPTLFSMYNYYIKAVKGSGTNKNVWFQVYKY